VFKEDALVIFDAIPELAPEAGPVHVLGYSLGSGIALHVAAHRPVASVLLEAPYARLCDLMTKRSWAPACLIPWVPRWDSLALAPEVEAPVYIVHGIHDEFMPSSESLRLAEAFIANGKVVVTRSRSEFIDASHMKLRSPAHGRTLTLKGKETQARCAGEKPPGFDFPFTNGRKKGLWGKLLSEEIHLFGTTFLTLLNSPCMGLPFPVRSSSSWSP
jgi:hypothetical protein